MICLSSWYFVNFLSFLQSLQVFVMFSLHCKHSLKINGGINLMTTTYKQHENYIQLRTTYNTGTNYIQDGQHTTQTTYNILSTMEQQLENTNEDRHPET